MKCYNEVLSRVGGVDGDEVGRKGSPLGYLEYI